MRTAVAVLMLSIVSVHGGTRADAAVEYDSAYGGESAFLTVVPGVTDTFTVFFTNTGSVAWVRGTDT